MNPTVPSLLGLGYRVFFVHRVDTRCSLKDAVSSGVDGEIPSGKPGLEGGGLTSGNGLSGAQPREVCAGS